MGEQPALRHVKRAGQVAYGQTFESKDAGHADGLVEDLFAGSDAFHGPRIEKDDFTCELDR
ncbi:MAG: hypothetical protein KC488_12285, partial [Candidatus Cloacimonetes bacterium]|nr:hypothetical protein [Candidatus Cloacimonadota bacterium]